MRKVKFINHFFFMAATIYCLSIVFLESVAKAIFNGVPAQGFEAVVALTHDKKVYCSGILVNSTTVITAAHCLEAQSQPWSENIQVAIGDGKEGGVIETHYPITSAEVYPFYRKIPLSKGWADIAYLKLKDPLPVKNFFSPLTSPQKLRQIFLDQSDIFKVNSKSFFTSVGFGLRGELDENGFGKKYVTTLPLLNFNSDEITLSGASTDVCRGDSGGPLLYWENGDYHIVGLVSHGTGLHCNGKEWDAASGSYTGKPAQTSFTQLPVGLCWVARQTNWTMPELEHFCYTEPIEYQIDTSHSQSYSFLNLCTNPSQATPTQRNTVDFLLGMANTRDCKAALSYLQGIKKLDLRNRFLSDLSPLLGLDSLQEISLDDKLRYISSLRLTNSLKKITVEFQENLLSQYLAITDERKDIEFNFTESLHSVYYRIAQEKIAQGNYDWPKFLMRLGLNKELMMILAVEMENTPYLRFLLSHIEKFTDEYVKETVFDYAQSAGDEELKTILKEKGS